MSELRIAFGHAVRTAGLSVAQAARDFHLSRKTAYQWLTRFDDQQPLHDQSRKPLRSPRRTPDALEQAVLAVRDQHGWGPRKSHAFLANHRQTTPPVRTIADILRRQQRRAPPIPSDPDCQRFERTQANELGQLDFKGWIELERTRVSPLTILDDHSRFLLALHPRTDLTMKTAWKVLGNVFGEYGLPQALLCDNAFGTNFPHLPGIAWFESRLLRLGIRPLHGRPYHPPTQGTVERLHGTLVREVYPRLDTTSRTRFTAGLEHWRQSVYNPLGPHEALGDQPPVTRWRRSERARPEVLPAVVYLPGSVLRRVGSTGLFHDRQARILAGQGLVGATVRVEEADGWVRVHYTAKEIRRIALDQLSESGIV